VTSIDGTPVAYRVSGRGDAVLFVHGSATSSADWLVVLPLLRDRLTVVTMDRRGRGRSGDGPDYAMEREAEDVLAVLDAVDAELLVGHSYGALCSILAAERTDRLRRLVVYEPPIAVKADWVGSVDELVAGGVSTRPSKDSSGARARRTNSSMRFALRRRGPPCSTRCRHSPASCTPAPRGGTHGDR
jgi:pimeloyl-ACP methyl ester carboxylesterase